MLTFPHGIWPRIGYVATAQRAGASTTADTAAPLTRPSIHPVAGDVAGGVSRANFERYLWGVTPCLMAWPAVVMPTGPGAFVIAATLGVVHIADRSFARRQLLPPWYMCPQHPASALRSHDGAAGLLLPAKVGPQRLCHGLLSVAWWKSFRGASNEWSVALWFLTRLREE